MEFKKAVREKVKLKIGLIGSSGSGKSIGALRIASGIISKMPGKKILVVDTEAGRGKYYADQFDYLYAELAEPFTPEKYIAVIDEVLKHDDIGILILDTISAEWAGPGGILEAHGEIPGNSFAAWSKLTPRDNKFVYKILSAPLHIICNVRGKDEYVLEDNEKGKKVPRKVGLGGVTRKGFEYEMTLVFNIDQATHIANATKDNTGLFDNRYIPLTPEVGVQLFEWAEKGKKSKPLDIKEPEEPEKPEKPKKEVKKETKKETPIKKEEDPAQDYADTVVKIKEYEEEHELATKNRRAYVNIMQNHGLTTEQMRLLYKAPLDNDKGLEALMKAIPYDTLREIQLSIEQDYVWGKDNTEIVEEILGKD